MRSIQDMVNGILVKAHYNSKNRNPNLWLFGEWFGKRCCDNSMYLANYIANAHLELKLFWACNEECDTSDLDKRIKRITIGTEEAMSVYAIAGVVIMNQGFLDFSPKGWNYFAGAITVNLWHGVMWKRIGHDGSKQSGTIYKLYVKASDAIFGSDYYIATSEDYAHVCESAFGANPQQVIRAGYPRNSLFYDRKKLQEARLRVLSVMRQETGVDWSEDVRIITYMPTFRDSAENSFSFIDIAENDALQKWLEENNTVILQKAHLITQQRHDMKEGTRQQRIIPFNNVAAQILLAATDLLVTDYSSCFFDFLLLDRPIVHYIYDYDFYANTDRGVYYDKDDVVCGDYAMSIEELIPTIIANADNPDLRHDLREKRRKALMTYDNKDTCETIYQAIRTRIREGKHL